MSLISNADYETARLAKLHALHILDSPPEQAYEDITTLASEIVGAPIALVSLVDADRQWFKACFGINVRETPRNVAFCAHAIEQPNDLFVIPDATKDDRFKDNPLVTGEPHIRFYAGAPLNLTSGECLGTLCVIDRVPRTMDSRTGELLKALARQVVAQIELQHALDQQQSNNRFLNRLVDELSMTRRRLSMAVSGTGAGLWDWNIRTGETIFNERWAEICGYTLEELSPLSIETWKNLCHPEDQELSAEQLAAHFSGATPFYECVVRMKHKDGSWRTVVDRGRVYEWDESGNPLWMAGTHLDITEARELRAKITRAEQLEMAGTIAGQVAHDFNNLLAPLTAYPAEIRDLLPDDHPSLHFVEIIEESARKMAEINEQLLTLSRRAHYKVSTIDLTHLVREVARDLSFGLPKTVLLSLDIKSDTSLVSGGESQLYRAIYNLIQNAREAMNDVGTIQIEVCSLRLEHNRKVYSGEALRGNYLTISVRDTGSGIPDDLFARVFEPYVTRKAGDSKRGTGLGLTVVDSVVRDHHGYVDVESRAGVGTCFTIYLPSVPADAVQAEEATPKSPPRIHVLVVDDDAMVREVTQRLLIRLGYVVTTASSGELAVSLCEKKQFDLLLIDMKMDPGIDGTETLRQVLELNPVQRALLFSGYSHTDRVEAAMQLGACGFIRKPFERSILSHAVEEALGSPLPARSSVGS